MGQYNNIKLPTSSYFVVGLIISTMVLIAFIDIHGFRPFIYGCSIIYLGCLFLRYSLVRQAIHNKLIFMYSFLIIYHTINCYLQHVNLNFESGYLPFFLGFYANIVVLIIVYALCYQNTKKTLKYLVVIYQLFVILALMSPGLLDSRYESERLYSIYIHPNQFSQCASMGLFVIIMYRVIAQKTLKWTIIVSALPIFSIFLCGSRNGLGQFLFVILTYFLGIMHQNKDKNIKLKLPIYFIILALVAYYIINNSYMGERLLQSNEITYNFDYIHTGTPLDWLGDRQVYYTELSQVKIHKRDLT